jgi:iron complex transport system ATP-binding protein
MRLSAQNLVHRYERRVVLEGVNFSVKGGELVALVGPNGAGKSTLLRRLSGALRGPGTVLIDGKALSDFSPKELARTLTMLEQEVACEFDFRVEELVALGRDPYRPRLRGLSQRDKEAVWRAMEALGIEGLAERRFSQLSGGERRKVLLATVLAQEPEVLLLDEPTVHLDIQYQLQIMALLCELTQGGRAVVCALHDLNLAAAFADRLVLLAEGKVVAQGTPEEVLTPGRLREVFGVEARVRRNPATGGVYIHFLPPSPPQRNRTRRVLVIAGGGAAAEFLPCLAAHYQISVGVVSPLDTDYEVATSLGLEVITEAPFTPVSDEAYERFSRCLSAAAGVVVCPVWFGPGNVRLLAALRPVCSEKPVLIVDPQGFPERDYSHGKATRLAKVLLANGATGVLGLEELIASLERLLREVGDG